MQDVVIIIPTWNINELKILVINYVWIEYEYSTLGYIATLLASILLENFVLLYVNEI